MVTFGFGVSHSSQKAGLPKKVLLVFVFIIKWKHLMEKCVFVKIPYLILSTRLCYPSERNNLMWLPCF